ncbi:MAG: type II toxin-antitoxin system RelE/ParE family toxin [Bacteroidota bacterium]
MVTNTLHLQKEREIDITEYCLDFIDRQSERVSEKFFQLIVIMQEVKIVHTNFVKKLTNTRFYELRIKAGNEYRIIIFAIDHLNFSECTKAVCLNGFIKKSNKDYLKAINEAEKILEEYLKNQEI